MGMSGTAWDFAVGKKFALFHQTIDSFRVLKR